MPFQQAQTALAALPGDTTDAAKVAYAQDTVYSWRPSVWIAEADLHAEAVLGTAAASAFMAGLSDVAASNQYPDNVRALAGSVYRMLAGSGLNLGDPETQASAALLVGVGGLTTDGLGKILDLARSNPRPRYQAEWGLSEFTADTLANLADRVKFETLAAAVDGLLRGIDRTLAFAAATPDAAVTFMGSAVADLPALRSDLQALSMGYGAKVANGQDVSDMPADAAGAWQRVTDGGDN